jgi:Family of unknown function (DUF6115)
MQMFLISLIGAAAVSCGAVYILTNRICEKRIKSLERDLQLCSEAVNQMAEIQMKIYHKTTGNLEEIEERLLELSVPSHDSSRPLEQRHHVLALSRKGMAIDDISKRLGMPRGEAELVVGLSRFMQADASRTAKSNGEVSQHA